MDRDEAPSGSEGLEALYLAFSSPEGLMRDLGPIAPFQALLMAGTQTRLGEGSTVGLELVVVIVTGKKSCFLSSLLIGFQAAMESDARQPTILRAKASITKVT